MEVLKGEEKKKAYAKTKPEECTVNELVTLLCTADGKGAEYKLRCLQELIRIKTGQ